MTHIYLREVGKTVARALLAAGCVAARRNEPFRLPSSWASPEYMNRRKSISFPVILKAIVSLSLDMLQLSGYLNGVTSIVGCEASGIALPAWRALESEILPDTRHSRCHSQGLVYDL